MAPSVTAPAHDGELLERAVFEVKRVIVGQDRLVERMLVGLLARGHLPARGRARRGQDAGRRDLRQGRRRHVRPHPVHPRPGARPTSSAPASTGRASEEFDVELGPVVANFVLADEINRAPAKVQSALLEVMAERQVSIGGKTYPMPDPFLVLATQNPIENEGVYPLPEAQRDRFLIKIVVDYPTRRGGARDRLPDGRRRRRSPKQVLDPAELLAAAGRGGQRLRAPRAGRLRGPAGARHPRRPAEHGLADVAGWIVLRRLARAPRSASSPPPARWRWCAAATTCCPQDVIDVAPDVLRHRLVLVLRRAGRRRPGRRTSSTGCCRPSRCRRSMPFRSRAIRCRPSMPAAAAAGRRPVTSVRRTVDPPSLKRGRRSATRADGRAAHARADGPPQARRPAAGRPPRPGARARAPSRASRGRTSPATTCAGWTGGHRPHHRCRTCGRRSPTASWRPGWSSTCRPASTSAPPAARSATWRSPPRPRSPTSPCGGGNRIGAVVATGERIVRDPGPRRPAARAASCCARVAATPARAGGTRGDLAAAHRGAAPPAAPARAGRGDLRLPRRARLGAAAARAVRRGTRCSAVEVLDPRELELPDVGLVVLVDPETGRQREVVDHAAAAPGVRRGRRRAPRAGGAARCAGAGAAHLRLRTDRDWIADVVRFVARPASGPGRAAPRR